jgi:hypothetical protein
MQGPIYRVRHMLPLMREFLSKVRIEEGILSAAIVSGTQTEMNAHNKERHRIAKLNYVHNVSCERISRYAAWTQDQATIRAQFHQLATTSPSDNASVPTAPTHLTPSCVFTGDVAGENRTYQVLFIECDKKVYLGVNMEVYRGALSKPKLPKVGQKNEPTSRVMRTSKPAAYSIPIEACKVMKVCLLRRIGMDEPNAWYTSCIEEAHLVDPLLIGSGVIGVAAVEKTTSRGGVLKLILASNTDSVKRILEDRPSHFK